MSTGQVRRVNGPVVEADDLAAGMLELVEVGRDRLPGEVIALDGGTATVQVYAYTGGLGPETPWCARATRCRPSSARGCSGASSTACCAGSPGRARRCTTEGGE